LPVIAVKVTFTGIPARTSPTSHPVMPVTSRGPSVSSTIAMAYGMASARAMCVGWRTTVYV